MFAYLDTFFIFTSYVNPFEIFGRDYLGSMKTLGECRIDVLCIILLLTINLNMRL